jgi:copper chaperone
LEGQGIGNIFPQALTFPPPNIPYETKQEVPMPVLAVPDMSCGHCKAAVETALAPLASKVTVDLPARRVTVEGTTEDARLLKALDDVGFPAHIISA